MSGRKRLKNFNPVSGKSREGQIDPKQTIARVRFQEAGIFGTAVARSFHCPVLNAVEPTKRVPSDSYNAYQPWRYHRRTQVCFSIGVLCNSIHSLKKEEVIYGQVSLECVA
jgi:hypothetical protein